MAGGGGWTCRVTEHAEWGEAAHLLLLMSWRCRDAMRHRAPLAPAVVHAGQRAVGCNMPAFSGQHSSKLGVSQGKEHEFLFIMTALLWSKGPTTGGGGLTRLLKGGGLACKGNTWLRIQSLHVLQSVGDAVRGVMHRHSALLGAPVTGDGVQVPFLRSPARCLGVQASDLHLSDQDSAA